MRLYLKLALMIAAAVLVQSALRPVASGAWEVQFAARCWLAYQLQDAELEARLVEEGQARLVQDLKRSWAAAELPVATVHASSSQMAVWQPEMPLSQEDRRGSSNKANHIARAICLARAE